jgi:hypothetical protein
MYWESVMDKNQIENESTKIADHATYKRIKLFVRISLFVLVIVSFFLSDTLGFLVAITMYALFLPVPLTLAFWLMAIVTTNKPGSRIAIWGYRILLILWAVFLYLVDNYYIYEIGEWMFNISIILALLSEVVFIALDNLAIDLATPTR